MNAMLDLVRRHKSGERVGIYSVCSAHPLVLEAAMRLAKRTGSLALVEATSNQVNQDGGYTGMRARGLPRAPASRLPPRLVCRTSVSCWAAITSAPMPGSRSLPPTALQKAGVMVGQYVAAGFRKIHLDCSMSCADDPRSLGDEVIAERAAALCEITEAQWRKVGRRAAGLHHRHRSAGARAAHRGSRRARRHHPGGGARDDRSASQGIRAAWARRMPGRA